MRSFYDRVHDVLTNKKDMKRKIFPRDFEPYYPIGIQPCPMYVDVANRIYDRTKDMELDLPDDDCLKREIAINAAIYYEDKMSGIGLWNAFVARHQRTYHRSLPFFDDYSKLYKDDVNLQEVQLLIWIVISRNFADRFLTPVAMGSFAASSIMAALSEDDVVEVNDALYDFVYNKAFVSKKADIVFAPNVVHAIRCKDNPYYKKCDARQMQSEVMNAVINVWAMHPELLNYLLDNNMI